MSEELFEAYLRNELDETGARELSAILETDEGARAFSEFVQEWTLLGGAALQRVAEADRRKARRRVPAPRPGRARIWRVLGLAAAAGFMILLATPTRHPPPAPPTPVVQATPSPVPEPSVPEIPPAPVPEPVLPPPAPLPAPEPAPEFRPPPVKPAPEKAPEPPPRPAEPTVVARPVVAVVSRVQGDVQVVSASGRRKAAAGEKVAPDEGVESTGLATLEFPDGSRIELGPETAVERLVEQAGRRSIAIARGPLSASVPKQAAGRFLALTTPHAEVTVIGTRFSLMVTAESTKLEVSEGRVRMTRIPDGVSVEVPAGNGAVAARGQKLESKPVVHTRDFQDGAGYVGTRDTAVSGDEPARAFGSEETLEVGGSGHALLKWDLTDLPRGAVVRSAVLTIHVLTESQGPASSLYEIKRPWTEAEATWQQPWRVAGLKSPADRGAEVLGSVAPRVKGILTILLTPAAEAVIQGWLRNPAANHGLLLAGDAASDRFRFSSREAFPHDLRPKLTLTYTVKP